MATRVGRVERWGRSGARFAEAFLDTGDRVEIPNSLRASVELEASGPTLVFVERRGKLFKFVQWIGTPEAAVSAEAAGELSDADITPEVRLLADLHRHSGEPSRTRVGEDDRAIDAVQMIRGFLPLGSRTTLLVFAELIQKVRGLDDAANDQVAAAYEDALTSSSYTSPMLTVSRDALAVGYAVRWVRWPNPEDPCQAALWRATVPTPAVAAEWAAAALAEPALDEEAVAALYAPLEGVIPRARLRAVGPCA